MIEEAKLDLFDLPIYHPTIEEVRQVIKSEGSFTLQTLKTFKTGYVDLQEDNIASHVPDSKIKGEFLAKHIRAFFEPLLLAYSFGHNIMDEIFLRFSKLAAQLIELETYEVTNIVLIMTKDP